jgi:hypothetical protein
MNGSLMMPECCLRQCHEKLNSEREQMCVLGTVLRVRNTLHKPGNKTAIAFNASGSLKTNLKVTCIGNWSKRMIATASAATAAAST